MASYSFLPLGLAIAALLHLLTQVTAHLELSVDEPAHHQLQIKRDSEALSNCLKSPAMQEHNDRMLEYRNETLHKLRKARGIDSTINLSRRGDEDRDRYSGINHEKKPGQSQDPQDLFNFRWGDLPHQYTGCALMPYSLYGPFWKERQPLRSDVRAGKRGIYLRLAMQVIDIKNCQPLQGAQVDIWHADSLGNYSQVMDGFLRGWQPTSYQGTVDFDTNFLGHYVGRTSHIHVSIRVGASARYLNVGQIYFDQNIIDAANAADHYNGNPFGVIKNINDTILGYDADSKFDTLIHWSRFGNSLEDGGLLGWATLGVDPTKMDVHQPPDGDHAKSIIEDLFHLL